MKKRIALLLAVLMLFGALPLTVQASSAADDAAFRVTRVPLDEVQTRVLALLEAALRARQDTVDLSEYRIGLSELIDVLNELNAAPEFFYFDSAMPCFDFYTEKVSYVELYYKEDYGEAELAAFEAAVQKALTAVYPGMSDLQKALALHDYLTQHIAYDYADYMAGTVGEKAYTAYGALVEGKAVCEGYAKAYQLLLDRCGIDAVMVSSLAMNHGWNLVKLEGSWYHVDVTWDDPVPDTPGKANHTYFLLSDSAIRSRDSGSGSLHYGWDGEIGCTDARYDGETLWSEMKQPLVFSDAGAVWLLRSEGQGSSQVLRLVRRDWNSGAETAVYSVRDYWPVLNSNAYWIGTFSGLCSWGGWVFFNDSLHIYAYDPVGGECLTVFTYGGGDGCLYGLTAADEGLYYLVSKSPDEPGTLRFLAPEVAPVPAPAPGPDPAPAPEPTPEPVPEPAPAPEITNPFADVFPSDYYYDAVLWAYENEVTKGTSADSFSPADSCNRGQVVTFLWRAAGCPAPSGTENPFADVPENAFYRDAVLWAVEQGITNGVGTDAATGKPIFDPTRPCSYAHILTFLYRAVTGNLSSSGAWYDDALRWAKDNGLLDGTLVGRDQGRVNADCPRSDVVTYLWRYAA